MFKKRPRASTLLSKRDPAYWRARLFKNVFTYKGKRMEVSNWSVKIQLFGKRKTFSLISHNRAQAAGEACHIYQTIADQGWEALSQSRSAESHQVETLTKPLLSPGSIQHDIEYWKRRLIHRKYPESVTPTAPREFSIRIEYARRSHFFPLVTSEENEAAIRATNIYRTVANKGWDNASATFPRELSIAIRWQDNPLAWTYTTVHTRVGNVSHPPDANKQPAQPQRCTVALVEMDAGIRLSLVERINSQKAFQCVMAFASVAEALGEIPRQRMDLVLANFDLPGESGTGGFGELQHMRSDLVVLPYSVFSDADELFKSTPGGSDVYMLKRTASNEMFDPIANPSSSLTHDTVISQVRNYFHQLSGALQSGPPLWKLAKLTPREQEILALLANGDLVKEIASKLGISNWTAQGHVKNIFEKLNVHSRTEAVVKYLQR